MRLSHVKHLQTLTKYRTVNIPTYVKNAGQGMLAAVMAVIPTLSSAAEPVGYYSSCEGKNGEALLTELYHTISEHVNVGYNGLWEVYTESDVRPDGTLWDIYSTKAWPVNFTKCGNYSVVGDCVNREHSLPKSWWGGSQEPQYSDAYHLYPTDGRVNGQRSNYPYGECRNGSQLPASGNVKPLGRLGTSTFGDYTGTVFEPDDEYKGDLARSYFYMAACYNQIISTFTEKEGAVMFNGTDFPAFTDYGRDLLLKWHRQDPVSPKEEARNEAIARWQKNRNPFIDHPEMVEHIWGDKSAEAWTLASAGIPHIITPVDGSTIEVGTTALNVARTKRVEVKGVCLTENITVSIAGEGFSVSATALTAEAVNNGTALTIIYESSTPGTNTATLTLSNSQTETVCTVSAAAIDGLPAGPAINVSSTSFEATWSCIDEGSVDYTLNVMRDGVSIAGYPVQVPAEDESFLVEDLESGTTYTYTVASATRTSAPVTVTTTEVIPSVQILFDGELQFAAPMGTASEIAELLVDAENVPGNITITVAEPFSLSTDKATWTQSVVLTPDEERFYMRLYGNEPGDYTTTLTVTADGYFNDDIEVSGTITDTAGAFCETFETNKKGYAEADYQGSAALWRTNGYVDSTDPAHGGKQCLRMNNKGAGFLYMLEDKANGMGTLSFWAKPWDNDVLTVTFNVSVSADRGATWENAGSVTVSGEKGGEYKLYTLPINREGNLRLRIDQPQKARTMVDDITITDHTGASGIEEANTTEYHTWDAYCRNGQLVMENSGERDDNFANVYGVDGTSRYASLLPAGETVLNLPAGLYIVVVRDFARRVVVK